MIYGTFDVDCTSMVEDLLDDKVASENCADLALRPEQAFDAEQVIVEGVDRLLHGLALPRCLTSSGSHTKIRHPLSITGIRHYYEVIYSADDDVHGKPTPDLFLYAASRLGVPPTRCAVVEDSDPGARGGAAGGI